ncbi:MAG TPA: HD domain-containing protein [Bacteroidales bacterium]|nr:HD domain-containing protein [Bacteroidales bacterium]
MSGPFESAEQQFKVLLEDFFTSIYDEKSLPSHGIGHHRRVWNYARELAPVLTGYNTPNPSFPGSLIIACYLHDLGMAIDPGITHGHHSANLCRQFLLQHGLKESDFPGLLSAILNHDNKNYGSNSAEDGLFTILSVSDDLDAFGFIGVFRYFEIYSCRGISINRISDAIRENAQKRFSHFEEIFSFDQLLTHKHRERYEVLDQFFAGLKDQLTGSIKPGTFDHIEIIKVLEAMMSEKNEISCIIKENKESLNPSLKWFFTGLSLEL